MKLLIKNCRIITTSSILNNKSLEIKNGLINRIGNFESFNESEFDKVIDGNGKFLSPGFIDIHNHGNSGYDVMNGTVESIDKIAKFHIKNGVTSFLSTVMTEENERMNKAIMNASYFIRTQSYNKGEKANCCGIYLEGPYFSKDHKGSQPYKYILQPKIEQLKKFIDLSLNNIKIVSVAPELEGMSECITYLKSERVKIFAGHTAANYREAKSSFDRGVIGVTHLYNGMPRFHHRDPGIVAAALIDNRIFCELICDGIHVHSAAAELAVKAKGKDKIILISDAMMAAGFQDGEYSLIGQQAVAKNKAITGATLTLNKAVYNMVNLVNIQLKDSVIMASLTPAKVIGLEKKKGSIEIGKDADLIIFDHNINIYTTIIGGRIVYNKQ